MKVSIDRAEFLRHMAVCSNSLEVKTTIPVLGCALIEAADGAVSVRVTDLDMTIKTKIPAEVKEPGAICVPLGKVLEFCKNFKDPKFQLEEAGTRVVVKCGKSTARLPIYRASDFPDTADSAVPEMTALGSGIMEVIDAVSFAAPNRAVFESKYSAYGVVIRTYQGKLFVFASNDHRCCFSVQAIGAWPIESSVLPMKLVDAIASAKGGADGTVLYGETPNQIHVQVGSYEISCRQSSFKPPMVEQVLNKFAGEDLGSGDRFLVSRQDALDAAKSASNFEMGLNRSYACRMSTKLGQVVVESLENEMGGVESVVDGDGAPEGFYVVVNARYLSDFLSKSDDNRVQIGYTDRKAPLILRSSINGHPVTYTVSPLHQ